MIIDCIDPCRGFNVYPAPGIFRYVHITPEFLMLILFLKLLSANPCNPLGFFPGTVLWKIVFQHADDLAYIIFRVLAFILRLMLLLRYSSKCLIMDVVAIQLL